MTIRTEAKNATTSKTKNSNQDTSALGFLKYGAP